MVCNLDLEYVVTEVMDPGLYTVNFELSAAVTEFVLMGDVKLLIRYLDKTTPTFPSHDVNCSFNDAASAAPQRVGEMIAIIDVRSQPDCAEAGEDQRDESEVKEFFPSRLCLARGEAAPKDGGCTKMKKLARRAAALKNNMPLLK